MPDSELYKQFCDAVAILQEDQPKLLENSTLYNYNNKKHIDLISRGNEMLNNLLKLAKKGESFLNDLPTDKIDIINKIITTINDYLNLFTKPKNFLCIPNCIKVNRNNIKYEKKFIIIKANIIFITFISIAIILEHEATALHMESVRSIDYVTKINDIFNALDKLVTKGDASIKSKSKNELLHHIDSIDRFILYYFDDNTNTFRLDARRKLKQLKELLDPLDNNESIVLHANDGKSNGTNPPPKTISRSLLVKVQSSLQEILNSGLAISLSKSRSSLYLHDDYKKLLKNIHDKEISSFTEIEEEINTFGLMDELHRLREESEIIYNDSNSKLKDAEKNWKSIKKQSGMRPVATLGETMAPSNQQSDPTKVITDFGDKGSQIVFDAVIGVGNTVNKVGTGVTNVLAGGANKVGSGITKVGTGIGSGIAKVGTGATNALTQPSKFLGLEDSPSSNNTNPPKNNSNINYNKNSFGDLKLPKFPNLLD